MTQLDLVTLKDAAKMLHLKPNTLRIYLLRKTITCVKVNKHIFFDRREVENYKERQLDKPIKQKVNDQYYSVVNKHREILDTIKY